MKKLLSLLLGGSLVLAGAALAQQPEEQQSPAAKQGGGKGHRQAAEGQPGADQANPNAGAGKHRGARNQQGGSAEQNPQQTPGGHHAGRHQGAGANAQGTEATPKSLRRGGKANVTGEPETNASPNGDQQGQQGRHGRNVHGGNAKTAPNATPATSVAPSVAPNDQQTGQSNAAASVAPNTQQNVQAQGRGKGKRPDPQQVQQIRQQHTNFRAQPRPDRVPAVTFNQSYRIEGSDRWQGPRYEVFRSYHPERHDERWYHSHYPRVTLIGGGYYYWNNGYWFPAWGYSSANEYYAYDGPIYVGQRALPPDQVVADVQDVLKQMGYYEGEVDGLLGPLTRQALTAYQADQGLTPTAAIDEPTLESLQMG